MPTARELLEQADALMRRNRRHGKGRLDASTLTGVLDARAQADEPSTVILPDTPRDDPDAIVLDRVEPPGTRSIQPAADAAVDAAPSPAADDEMSLDTLADLPVLTEVVDWPDAAAAPATVATGVPDDAPVALDQAFPASADEAKAAEAPAIAIIEREVDTDSADVAGPATAAATGDAHAATTASARVASAAEPAPPPFLDDDFILEIPPLDLADAAPSPPPPISEPAAPGDGAAWAALAEELRMQVLQRLDLFTDTGLRQQLGERLAPIVERASTQMIETINRELGELVRAYVAEAIEREIETWRSRSDR